MFDPLSNLIRNENEHLLLCFCTYCTLVVGKKLSLQNVFLLVIKEKRYRELFKELTGIGTDYEIVKLFIDFDNTIVKSKYITKYINSLKNDRTRTKNL